MVSGEKGAERRVLIVGAGFSGAVLARELAEAGLSSLVIDERSHAAGNCHTERDARTGVMTHVYGPHIFHTGYDRVWDYIRRFGEMMPYVNRVKTTVGGRVYSLPINLHTINQFFGATMGPAEARAFVAAKSRRDIVDPQTFEEQALAFVGDEMYRAFFHGYTMKQWGVEPARLPASILKRLPLRFNYDDNYFAHPHQGMPRDGYTAIVDAILDHPAIELRLGASHERLAGETGEAFAHLFYTGPIDRYFGYELGELGYRTLDFERFHADEDDWQGTAVMNYGDPDVPFTRISEHKHFAPWEAASTRGTVCFREFSRACTRSDTPFYPIRLADEKRMLERYVERARATRGVTFMGRLGTYQYLDMDETIHRALATAEMVVPRLAAARASAAPDLPSFVQNPL